MRVVTTGSRRVVTTQLAQTAEIMTGAGTRDAEMSGERLDVDLQPLQAADFQEMWPASALALASGGDALSGVNRADSASVTSED